MGPAQDQAKTRLALSEHMLAKLRRSRRWVKLTQKVSRKLKKVRRPAFKLLAESTYLSSSGLGQARQLTKPERQNFQASRFFGKQSPTSKVEGKVKQADAVTVSWLNDATVIGGTNFALIGSTAVHPDLYVHARDISPIELYGKAKLDVGQGKIRIPMGLGKGRIPKAINLCDQTSGNYAHWLTETLPKLALLDQSDEFKGVPLLVDGWIHRNHLDSLRAIDRHKRPIIGLGMFEHIRVDRLLSVSPTAYCPHEYRNYNEAMLQGFEFYFSREALHALRDNLRATFKRYIRPHGRALYLQRMTSATSNGRQVLNMDELEDIIYDHGIETFNVSGLSFAQQAKIFVNAEFMLAPTGAALANMIFAKPGCRIVVLAATYPGASYDYFTELAQLLGHELIYVVGPQSGAGANVMHRDYSIDPQTLKECIKSMMNRTSAHEYKHGFSASQKS